MKNLWSKKWRRVLVVLVVCAAFALALGADGQLARPEQQAVEGDRFIGFQLVYERMPGEWEEVTRDYSNWVEYGSETVQLDGIGSVSFPRKILIGTYDEETGRYQFPGLEGRNCFLCVREGEDGGQYYTGYTDMANVHTKVGNGEHSISGTVYFGPPLDDTNWNTEYYDYGWRAYRVYQMDDGTVYLDGSGNSYGGVGGFGFSTKETYTETVDGEEKTTSFEVSVNVESVERVREISVTWFDGDNRQVAQRTIPMEDVGEYGLTLERPQGAVWALVAETDRLGNVKRSSYTLLEEAVVHSLVRLDERGMGEFSSLTLE